MGETVLQISCLFGHDLHSANGLHIYRCAKEHKNHTVLEVVLLELDSRSPFGEGNGPFQSWFKQELLVSVAPALFPCDIRAGNLPLAAHASSMQNKVCSSHLYYQDYLQPTWLRSWGKIGAI